MITDSRIVQTLLESTRRPYPLFAEYCDYLDKGLRKKALQYLDEFLDLVQGWNYPTRATFCRILFSASITTENDLDFVLTTNLKEKLVKPTLLDMTLEEPSDHFPFKWYGQYFKDTKFIKKAYELNPSDQSIKIILLKRLAYDLWLSTHHLPDFYLGNFEEDERDIKLAFLVMEHLEPEAASYYFLDFKYYEDAINKYKFNDAKLSR